MGKNWHITRNETSLTLSRRRHARFDVAVETVLSGGSKTRLAHQIRQDLWRALQNLRGFSPAVQITTIGAGVAVRAGGQIDGAFPRLQIETRIADVLENPKNRTQGPGDWRRLTRD